MVYKMLFFPNLGTFELFQKYLEKGMLFISLYKIKSAEENCLQIAPSLQMVKIS